MLLWSVICTALVITYTYTHTYTVAGLSFGCCGNSSGSVWSLHLLWLLAQMLTRTTCHRGQSWMQNGSLGAVCNCIITWEDMSEALVWTLFCIANLSWNAALQTWHDSTLMGVTDFVHLTSICKCHAVENEHTTRLLSLNKWNARGSHVMALISSSKLHQLPFWSHSCPLSSRTLLWLQCQTS